MSVLYVVATPIGNLEDITFRALRVLREVSLIAAEDTRKTGNLLRHFAIKTPLTSYFEHNKITKLNYVLDRLADGDVALVSEAGTPGINDPGYELIEAAIARDIPVVVIPGPSIAITALTVSGLPTDRFLYLGFLPNKTFARRRFLKSVLDEPATLILLESPHRVTGSLEDILAVLGDRRVAVCREMTKVHEEVFRGTVSQAVSHFVEPRGEFTFIVEGKSSKEKPGVTSDIMKRLSEMRSSGISAREAVMKLAGETGISRKELYRKWLETQKF